MIRGTVPRKKNIFWTRSNIYHTEKCGTVVAYLTCMREVPCCKILLIDVSCGFARCVPSVKVYRRGQKPSVLRGNFRKQICAMISERNLPSVPFVPEIPGIPFRPGVPGIPSKPFLPGIPSNPGSPGTPSLPSRPGSPVGIKIINMRSLLFSVNLQILYIY